MILNVPHYSQRLDVVDPKWKRRSCAVVCIKMLADSKGVDAPSLDQMIEEAVEMGAFGPSGWIHDGLIKLASKYSITLKRAEWRKSETKTDAELMEDGVEFLRSKINSGHPVIVSVIKYLKPYKPEARYQRFHIVILTGIKEEGGELLGFFYHDPNTQKIGGGKNRFVSLEAFKKSWRRMAIFPA